MANKYSSRIDEVRRLMSENNIDAAIIIHTDPHHSEYLAPHWQVRSWLSGFTGSAGNLVITRDEALLWTDSRYFLQAGQQLQGSGISLMKDGLPATPSINDFLLSKLHSGDTIGVDGMLVTVDEAKEMAATFATKNINVKQFDPAQIWTDRPAIPDNPAYLHDEKYSGEPTSCRMRRVLDNVANAGADASVICALDEIAWILNLRGSDVMCSPVLTSFLFLSEHGSTLFVEKNKISARVAAYLTQNGIDIRPYTDILAFLTALPVTEKVLFNPATTAKIIADSIGEKGIAATSPVAIIKACKNDTQISNLRNALKRDSVALINLMMEIERRLRDGESLTEIDIERLATRFRSEQPLYVENSFVTIAGYREHGAIVHYTANEESNATILPEGLLLIDSGAQYLDGTTDITRTITLGNTTPEERRDFTLVMKGHIALARAIFPEGTVGAQLDALARQFLWADGKSYLHGTGHGIGFFLNVHEGPQSIRLNYVPTPLLPGMVTSNEPGIYIENRYGIRCENLVLTVPHLENEFGRFFRFETLTLFPFDLRLFDTSIMTDEEIQWVNNYHARCRKEILPLLNDNQAAWLIAHTRPLTRN